MGIQALLDTQVLSVTGSTGDVMTLQADGSYLAETPAGGGSPGGSSGQIQYNNAGAFGGTVAVVYAGSGSHLSVTAQAATDVPVTVQGAVSQTANLQEWKNSSGTSLAYVYPDGRIRVAAGSFAAGGVELGSTNYRLSVHSSGIYIVSNNTNTLFVSSSDVRLKAGSQLAFSNNASFASNAASSGIEQVSSGVLRVTDGGSNTRDLIVRNLRMSAPTLVPASAAATGSEGQIAWDADYIYICTATDTWKRVAIATW
jgi:hypothetical protein